MTWRQVEIIAGVLLFFLIVHLAARVVFAML